MLLKCFTPTVALLENESHKPHDKVVNTLPHFNSKEIGPNVTNGSREQYSETVVSFD